MSDRYVTKHFTATNVERYWDCRGCVDGIINVAETERCPDCNGTGRVLREGIDPDAEPEIEVRTHWTPANGTCYVAEAAWGKYGHIIRTGRTKDEVLTAVRKALKMHALGITEQDIAETMPPKPEMER